METVNGLNLGRFLKKERESRGLTIEHLAKVTRLRTYYIEALENEEWKNLPDLVFIKGFLKTYTRALGLDYTQVMKQFESSVPIHEGLPKPLVPTKKINKIYVFFIVLAAAIILLFVINRFRGAGSIQRASKATETIIVPENKTAQTAPENNKAIQVQPAQATPQVAADDITAPEKETASTGTMSGPAKEATPSSDIEPAKKEAAAEKPVQADNVPEQPVKILPVQPQPSAAVAGQEQSAAAKDQYVLECSVTETTYVKIWVDKSPPVQHMFPSGSRHQWTGREGFYLLVGNAGGIEFDFNGKKLKGLGRQGEVVRLRLPENFNLNIDGN
jgi:cytoskeleton protein RodZ